MTPYEKIEEIASETQGTQSIKELETAIGKIYQIAHVMVGRCGNKHSDWVREFGLMDDVK